MTPPQFDVEIRSAPEAVTVIPSGELDISTADQLREALNGQEDPGRLLVLDLSQLEFIDLVGLRVVMEEQRRAEADGFGLRLAVGSGAARRLLDLVGSFDDFPGVAD